MEKKKFWVSFLRIVIYIISFVGAVIGACVTKAGGMSSALNDGTSEARIKNGEIIFAVSIIILVVNIIWGIIRYVEKMYDKKVKPAGLIARIFGSTIWRGAVFGAIFLSVSIFIAPKVSSAISNNVIAERDNYKPINLSENYDRLEYINEHFDELNFDDIKDELAELMYSNIDFGTDASSNISTTNSSPFFKNASAYSAKTTVLNKAILSSDGHFVVFYTDTGDDAISDSKAAELGEMAENIIRKYKENLGLDYSYERFNNNLMSTGKIIEVLRNSGINLGVLDTAMPIYVANPNKEDVHNLASYAGRRFLNLVESTAMKLGALLGIDKTSFYNSAISYPFVNILPKNADSESLAIVTAHELGHHYMSLYSYGNYGKNGSDDNFIDETTPNWMAINVLTDEPENSLINNDHYSLGYLSYDSILSINEAGNSVGLPGYSSVAFLQNYYEIVPDSQKIIMDATHFGDALNYLYSHAGEENYKKVMLQLMERNITGDYGGKLKNLNLPRGQELNCADFCTEKYNLNYSSTKYVYVSTTEYNNTVFEYSGTNNTFLSVFGKNADEKWEVIESGVPSGKFEINDETAKKYSAIIIGAANHSITENSEFTVKIAKKELKEVIADEGNFDFSYYASWFKAAGAGCYDIDTDELFSELQELTNKTMELMDKITELQEALEPGTDYSSDRAEYHRGAEAANKAYDEVKTELSPYLVTVCGNYIKKGSQFSSIKNQLQKAVGGGFWNVYNASDADGELSVFVNYNPLATNAKIYFLARLEQEMGLITINIKER